MLAPRCSTNPGLRSLSVSTETCEVEKGRPGRPAELGEDEIFMATNYPHSDFWMRDGKRGTEEKPPFEVEARDSESAKVLGLVVVVTRTKAADS